MPDSIDVLPAAEPMLDRLADVVRVGRAPWSGRRSTCGDGEVVHALRAMPLPDHCIGVALEDVTERARLAGVPAPPGPPRPPDRTAQPGAPEPTTVGGAATGPTPTVAPTGLLLMDLNQFKEVNDALGHEYGDRLLVELARRLSSGMRNCDTIARLGGDEFAVLLTDVRDENAALSVADRLVELCVEPFPVDEFRLQVGRERRRRDLPGPRGRRARTAAARRRRDVPGEAERWRDRRATPTRRTPAASRGSTSSAS